MPFSSYRIAALLLCAPVWAQNLLILRDDSGRELRRTPALIVSDGLLAVGRQALLGAASADTVTGTISGIAAEDPTADLALLPLSGARDINQYPSGELEAGMTLAGPGFSTAVEKEYNVPGFGMIYRLRHEKNHPLQAGALWNSRGEVTAWYIPKTVDGQRFSFALPIARLRCLSRGQVLSFRDWNARLTPRAEEQFARAAGYFWLEDFDGASFHFRELTRLNPQRAMGWFCLAFSDGKMGRTREKMASYNRAVELAPLWGEAHFNLGFGYLLTGQRDAAAQEVERLGGIDPILAAKLEAFSRVIHIDPMPLPRTR